MLSRVKIPKITTVTFFRKRPFVGVLSLCCPFLILLFVQIFFLCLELVRFYFGKNYFNVFLPHKKSGCWAGLTSKRFISSFFPQDIPIFNPAQPHFSIHFENTSIFAPTYTTIFSIHTPLSKFLRRRIAPRALRPFEHTLLSIGFHVNFLSNANPTNTSSSLNVTCATPKAWVHELAHDLSKPRASTNKCFSAPPMARPSTP